MSGASLCFGVSARRSVAPSPFLFTGFAFSTMKSCCEQAGAPAPRGPLRRLLSYLLYAVVVAALGFVLWQQWQA
jgi:hypothetical protein